MKSQVSVHIELDPSRDTPEVVIRAARKTELVEKLASAIEQWFKKDAPRVAVSDGGTTVLLDQKSIMRVYTEPRRLMVCADRGTFEARCSLKEMEKTLDPEIFVRISRFELINMDRVAGFDMRLSGTIQVTFDDGSGTWVARRYVQAIQQRLDQLSAKGGDRDE